MKRKILASVLACALVSASLIGCGSSAGTETTGSTGGDTVASGTEAAAPASAEDLSGTITI